MAGPITWRTVQGDGGRMGAQLLQGGSRQLDGAADSLLRTLDQYRQMNVANAGIIKADNTQNFLDQVAAAGGADQLALPEVQQQLDQIRLQYPNGAIDRNVARGAVAERLASLQKQGLANQQYADVQQEVAQRPVLEDLAAKLYAGDTEGYNKVLDTNNLKDEADLRKQLQSYTDDATNRGYRAAGEQRAQGAEQRAIASDGRAQQSFNLSQEVGRENLANTREERTYRKDQREVALASDAIKMVADESAGALALKQQGNIFATGSTDPTKDAQAILKNAGIANGEFDSWLGSNDTDRQRVQKTTVALLTDGVPLKRDGKEVNVPIPPALIEQYLASTSGEIYISKDPEKEMSAYFSNLLKDNPVMAARAFEGLDAKQEHNKLVNDLKKEERKLRLSKNPQLSSTLDSIQSLRSKLQGGTVPAPAMLPGREEDLLYK